MTRRRYPIGAMCGHVGCPDARCWWQHIRPHTADNPDPWTDRCRYCARGHLTRRSDGWTVCDWCGSGRWTREAVA